MMAWDHRGAPDGGRCRDPPVVNRVTHRIPGAIHMLLPYRSTRVIPYGDSMEKHNSTRIAFEVTLVDGTRERISGANAYQQEHSMTTFFQSSSDRQTFDCWSMRVASFRTDSILSIRRMQAGHDSAGARRHLMTA